MHLIDSHCHPQLEQYNDDREAMIRRSLDAGVGMMVIGTTIEDSIVGTRLAEQYPHDPIWAAVGVHPTDSDIADIHPAQLEALLGSPKVVAIGETGLDYFHVTDPDQQDMQSDVFEQHILLAKEKNLPLIIHCRDKVGVYEAYDHIAVLLRRHQYSQFVMHCFSGRWKEAEMFLDLGGMISFSGVITFPKSDEIQDVVRQVPAERYLIETDAPFLAPVPNRGKRNEPAYVQHVAEMVAKLRNETVDDVALQTLRSTQHFFRLPPNA